MALATRLCAHGGRLTVAVASRARHALVRAREREARLRGVVEGYYGRPWPHAARRDVIRFLGTHGLNTFVYAPKNDP